jgi:hypothetical protein
MAQELQGAIQLIQDLVRGFYRQKEHDGGESDRSEAYRYRYGGARDMLLAVSGQALKDKVLDEVRRRTGLKIPHAGDRAPGGGYYMTDSDADV